MPAWHQPAYRARWIYKGLGAFCGWAALTVSQHLSLLPLHKWLCPGCCMQLHFSTIHSWGEGWDLAKPNTGFTAQFSWVSLIGKADFSRPYRRLAALPSGFPIRLLQPLLICCRQPFFTLTATFSSIFFPQTDRHGFYNAKKARASIYLHFLLYLCIHTHIDIYEILLKHQPMPSQGGAHLVPQLQPNL